jgi:hypothetical protein
MLDTFSHFIVQVDRRMNQQIKGSVVIATYNQRIWTIDKVFFPAHTKAIANPSDLPFLFAHTQMYAQVDYSRNVHSRFDLKDGGTVRDSLTVC